jgi:membrane-associated phospholipid phosphatase
VINEIVFFLINEFVRRPRPTGYGIVVEQDITKIYGVYSFPSGHVMYTLAFLGIVLFLIFQRAASAALADAGALGGAHHPPGPHRAGAAGGRAGG